MKLPKFEYLYCYYHEKDTLVKPHFHNCFELTYFCDGNSVSETNGETYKCFAGNFLIYPSGRVHNEAHLSKVKVLCLGFTLGEEEDEHAYDRLFSVENTAADERDFHEMLNPNSLTVLENCYVEEYAKDKRPGDFLQFQRIGYFMPDPDGTSEKLVFNRTVGLKDTWAKINK